MGSFVQELGTRGMRVRISLGLDAKTAKTENPGPDVIKKCWLCPLIVKNSMLPIWKIQLEYFISA